MLKETYRGMVDGTVERSQMMTDLTKTNRRDSSDREKVSVSDFIHLDLSTVMTKDSSGSRMPLEMQDTGRESSAGSELRAE